MSANGVPLSLRLDGLALLAAPQHGWEFWVEVDRIARDHAGELEVIEEPRRYDFQNMPKRQRPPFWMLLHEALEVQGNHDV